MGTNYYAELDDCKYCGRSSDRIHIGKSSAGWTFGFRGYRDSWELDTTIESEEDWREWLSITPHIIRDEYGNIFTDTEFWDIVNKKRTAPSDAGWYFREFS